MKKIVRLTESDLVRIIKKVITEDTNCTKAPTPDFEKIANNVSQNVIQNIERDITKTLMGASTNQAFNSIKQNLSQPLINEVISEFRKYAKSWIIEGLKCRFTDWGCKYFTINNWFFDVINIINNAVEKHVLGNTLFEKTLSLVVNSNNVSQFKSRTDRLINYIIDAIHSIIVKYFYNDLPLYINKFYGNQENYCASNIYVKSNSDLKNDLRWVYNKAYKILDDHT